MDLYPYNIKVQIVVEERSPKDRNVLINHRAVEMLWKDVPGKQDNPLNIDALILVHAYLGNRVALNDYYERVKAFVLLESDEILVFERETGGKWKQIH